MRQQLLEQKRLISSVIWLAVGQSVTRLSLEWEVQVSNFRLVKLDTTLPMTRAAAATFLLK